MLNLRCITLQILVHSKWELELAQKSVILPLSCTEGCAGEPNSNRSPCPTIFPCPRPRAVSRCRSCWAHYSVVKKKAKNLLMFVCYIGKGKSSSYNRKSCSQWGWGPLTATVVDLTFCSLRVTYTVLVDALGPTNWARRTATITLDEYLVVALYGMCNVPSVLR